MPSDTAVIVTAYNEADRIAATLAAVADALPGAVLLVADDGSSDGTAALASAAGAEVVRAGTVIGKGGAATLAARRALAPGPPPAVVLFCDGDLGDSARRLDVLVGAVRDGECDLAIAAFTRRVGGGFGVAVGFAGWAIRRLCGLRLRAPISGQRAVRGDALAELLPFAARFGMEVGMTVDAARAGLRIAEFELDLEHRRTGRTLRGFVHRGRQLLDFALVYASRARRSRRAIAGARRDRTSADG
jgi:glycosyltransferase involved in cell wall biosynthesis